MGMRADGQDDGFPQSLCNRPPSALELDPPAQLDPPALAQREVEPDDLEVWRRASGVLPFVAQPAPGLEQRASQFPVEVVRVPVAVMLECDFVGLFFAGHALRREDDGQPVLERPHVALDLALCLRGWRYEVEHPERPAHAPELGLGIFAFLAEHRERVRVQRQRDAYVREHLLERGVVRRKGAEDKPAELAAYDVVKDIKELKDVDVAILATPTRSCEEYAKQILPLGINTVDSFDIHTNIRGYRERLMEVNKQTGTVSVIAAGWDPGSDSIVRTLMQSLAPKGLSYTNFGPGMSMGHSVCVRSKEGVKNALSMTIPLGEGIHRRMVYVELEDGAKLEDVTAAIKADPYFANDETHVFAVESVDAVKDMGHGVHLVRKGVSGKTQNQRLEFNMSINNPALTAQVLVNVARASMRQQPGCYTMIELPVIDMLPGERADLIEKLV